MKRRALLYNQGKLDIGTCEERIAKLTEGEELPGKWIERLKEEYELYKSKGLDADQIKTAMESFSKATYDVFGKVYQQQNAQGGANPGDAGFNPGNGGANVNDDGTVDSEFTDGIQRGGGVVCGLQGDQRRLHQGLGVLPGDQHGGGDLELETHEVGAL